MITFLAGSAGVCSKIEEIVDKLNVMMLSSIKKGSVPSTVLGVDLFRGHLSIESLEGNKIVLS